MSLAYDLVLRGATLVTRTGINPGDLAVRAGRIAAIGKVEGVAIEEVDAHGLHLLPGGIDTQVHFREPGLTHKEDLESGTRAAVAGGVTTVFEMPNTDPTTTTAEALADKLARAAGRAWCDHAFFVGASPQNLDQLEALEQLPGTPGVKIFMGSSTGSLLVDDDETLGEVLRRGVRPCPVHAEDEPRNRARKELLSEAPHPREHPYLRDAESARLATERLIRLCAEVRRPVHVLHVSTLEELPLLEEAKRLGLPVTCEVTPQHLTFCAEDYETLGSLVQMNPPIRAREHREAIWAALEAGLFDVFGSDHAPHTLEEKAWPYPASPSGMPGVQTLLPVLLGFVAAGRLSLAKVAHMLCARPAELYGIQGKGALAVGMDADLVAVDLDGTQPVEAGWLQSKCGWSPFEGRTLRGRVVSTWVRGHLAWHEGRTVDVPHGAPVRFDWKAGAPRRDPGLG